jgi:precorrin-3B synthase
MQSGDGLIVRLRLAVAGRPGGGLRSAQLRTLAQLARQYGNGQLEVTRRANIQLRGVGEAALATLQAQLLRHSLGAATAQAERTPALLVHPLAGIDPRCAGLARVASELERMLLAFDRAASLPAKLAIVLDAAGECAALSQLRADVRVEVSGEEPARCRLSASAADGTRQDLGVCALGDVVARVRRLLSELADYNDRSGDARARMSEMLAADGGETNAADGGENNPPLARAASVPLWPSSLIGFHASARNWFGLAVPFGSADASLWLAIAALSEQYGDGEIRVTPSRSLLLLGVQSADAAQLAAAARQHGLLVEPGDPLLRVVACVGAPRCSAAWGETRELARTLAQQLPPGLASLHVSGCAKSCASSGPSDITLIRDADGCKLGFGLDAAQTALSPVMPIAAARRQLASHFAHTIES